MEALTGEDIRSIFELLKQRMTEHKDRLTEMDSALGDGDLGLTMSAGFQKAAEAVRAQPASAPIGQLFQRAGSAMASSAPSTMGTLIATGLLRAGKAALDRDGVSLPDLARMMQAFVEGMMARGKAQPGEKTILDSLHPASEALLTAAAEGRDLREALRSAVQKAEEGFNRARELPAVHGRAAYYGDASAGKPDGGAAVGLILVRTLAEYAGDREKFPY